MDLLTKSRQGRVNVKRGFLDGVGDFFSGVGCEWLQGTVRWFVGEPLRGDAAGVWSGLKGVAGGVVDVVSGACRTSEVGAWLASAC